MVLSNVAVTNLSVLSAPLSSRHQTVGQQVLSDHLWGFSCDVSQRSFISFVAVAGLTLVVITLGCFLQLSLIKHIALWLSLDVGLILQSWHPQMGCTENEAQSVAYTRLCRTALAPALSWVATGMFISTISWQAD